MPISTMPIFRATVFAAISLLISNISHAQHPTEIENTDCGIERWSVKVLKDPDTSSIVFNPVKSSVSEQTQMAVVSPSSSAPRLASEDTVFQIQALITEYKLEDDGDIHIVLHDPNTDSSMIAEIPNPDCSTVIGESHVSDYSTARQWITNNIGKPTTSFKFVKPAKLVTISGVGFYDPPHGQTGKAANNREIHPVLSISLPAPSPLQASSEAASTTFSVYPDPARDIVNVFAKLFGEERILSINISGVTGEVVYKHKADSDANELSLQIPTTNIPNGAYTITLYTSIGITHQKLIIAK